MPKNLTGNDLRRLGFAEGRAIGLALTQLLKKPFQRLTRDEQLDHLRALLADPAAFLADPQWGATAVALLPEEKPKIGELTAGLPYKVYGEDQIEAGARHQMNTAMRLSVTVAGALMPDAHQGYGLPIGGVLATDNAVIPYAVGVDIGCRMALSIFDLPPTWLEQRRQELQHKLLANTRFGTGQGFAPTERLDHEVLTRDEFRTIPFLRGKLDKTAAQIGSSGSGNHFVEFGIVEITAENPVLGVAPGRYVGLLSHSGSRGLGAGIADHYTKLAMTTCPLPPEARFLAWLDLATEAGQEYWAAMNLAGDYASANHHQIHQRLAHALGEKPLAKVENHHNFAWKEIVDGREVIVHRKGATPAGAGVLGIIPGSMTAPGFIVAGRGERAALASASHGAGRQMSRTRALQEVAPVELRRLLDAHGVELIGGGLDEAPQAYKDINTVMAAQTDLVDVLGTFAPKIVRMEG